MARKNCRAKTKSCLKFSVVALSILVAGTALGNQVSAAEVHPTISTQSPILSDEAREMASWLRSKIVNFVKSLRDDIVKYESIRKKLIVSDFNLSLVEIARVGLSFVFVRERFKKQIENLNKSIFYFL